MPAKAADPSPLAGKGGGDISGTVAEEIVMKALKTQFPDYSSLLRIVESVYRGKGTTTLWELLSLFLLKNFTSSVYPVNSSREPRKYGHLKNYLYYLLFLAADVQSTLYVDLELRVGGSHGCQCSNRCKLP